MANPSNSINGLISNMIRRNQLELNTFMPAKVITYYPDTQTVDVQLTLKRTLVNPPSTFERPRLYGIPVMWARTATQFIHLPLNEGDNVGILFCQRSLDEWKQLGKLTKVDDVRLHDVTDGVCIAGLDTKANSKTLPSDTKLSIVSTSGLWIGNPEGTPASTAGVTEAELFQALAEMCSILSSLTTTTVSTGSMTPQGVVNTTGVGTIDTATGTKLTELSTLFSSIAGN